MGVAMRLVLFSLFALLALVVDSDARADNSLVSVYQKQCDAGDAFYCQALGVALENGNDVPVDKAGAAAAFVKACDGDAVVACRYAGDLYATGSGVARDTARAAALYRRACDNHDAQACEKLSQASVEGTSRAGNGPTGTAQYVTPDKKFPAGSGPTRGDSRASLAKLERACGSGDGKSCRLLGDAYDSGEGTDRTSLKQAELYEKACALKDGVGCYKIGSLYKFGLGVRENEARAQAAFEKGCTYGNDGSCLMLPARQRPVAAPGPSQGGSFEKLVDDTKRACDQGNQQACRRSLLPEAEQACARRDGDACFRLGNQYSEGTGVPKDTQKAITFYDKGCDANDLPSCGEFGASLVDMYHLRDANAPADERRARAARRAQAAFRKICRGANEMQACRFADDLYSMTDAAGDGSTRNISIEHRLFITEEACEDAKHQKSCYDGRLLALAQRACANNNGPGCYLVGRWYSDGQVLPRNVHHAIAFYAKACGLNDVFACRNFGSLLIDYYHLLDQGVPGDQRRAQAKRDARLAFRKACEYGIPAACLMTKNVLQ
jgi:uncharacterized protein